MRASENRNKRKYLTLHPRQLLPTVMTLSFLSPTTPLRTIHTTLSRALLPRHLRSPLHMRLARKSAAALIIGDEILTGKTLDLNTQTLARFLVSQGVQLCQTHTVADDIDTIATSVHTLATSYDLVFTSGGIGPTLDDRTYAGIAQGFELELRRDEETVRRMGETQPEMELNEARLRMALLPNPCEVFWTDGLWVPLVCVVGKVYVLPGIPRLFQRMLGSVPVERFGGVMQRIRRVVYCEMAEGDIAQVLDEADREFEDVAFGSYPATTEMERRVYRTKITVEGDEEGEVLKAVQKVCQGVGGRVVEGL